jgi:phosphoribosyl-ATP pyrophosphohydrolase/phosphoribosyl-AMP cyclohydrolase
MAVIHDPKDLSGLNFGKSDGLLPVIVQHADTAAVLMLGYMNAEALRLTQARGRVVFYSRSRQTLWEKGETSGHTLSVEAIRVDCDADTLLITARPQGPTCHEGTSSCFGEEALTGATRLGFLAQLAAIIDQRATEAPETSYTARLLTGGTPRMAQKVGEEGVEVALAAVTQGDAPLIGEAADLVFHLMVLLKSRGLNLEDVAAQLAARHASRRAPGG